LLRKVYLRRVEGTRHIEDNRALKGLQGRNKGKEELKAGGMAGGEGRVSGLVMLLKEGEKERKSKRNCGRKCFGKGKTRP